MSGRFWTPCRWSASGASVRRPPQAPRQGASARVGQLAQLGEATLVSIARSPPGPPPARHGPRPRPAAGSATSRSRLVRGAERTRPRAASPEAVDAVRPRAGRPRHAPHARVGPGRPHGRAAAALRRLLASHALTDAAARDRGDEDGPRHGRTLLGASRTTIERRGLTLVGVTVSNLDPRRCRHAARAAARRSLPRRARCRARRGAPPRRPRPRSPGRRCCIGTSASRTGCSPTKGREFWANLETDFYLLVSCYRGHGQLLRGAVCPTSSA